MVNSTCLPCTASSTGGNNANPGLCPILHDYRPFTDYQPRCASVYKMTQSNAFHSSYDQREWLIHNADNLITKNAVDAYLSMRCKCVQPWDVGTMVNEVDVQHCTDRICTFNEKDKFGLGTGRQFYSNEKDQAFKSKFAEEKAKEQNFFKENDTCCGTVNDRLYWPIDGQIDQNYERLSVPSGGQQLSVGGNGYMKGTH